MGAPPLVVGDRITGQCVGHQVPGPFGAPVPAPAPLPFSAPIAVGIATTVLIGGKFAAVVGSSGFNAPPHVGLHVSDPFFAPPMQIGRVLTGSGTVLFDGRFAATQQSSCLCCVVAGQGIPSITNVQIG